MADRKTSEPSPTAVARADRQRLASQEGAKAMADIERQSVDVRKNMDRLRALRLAKEAEDAAAQADAPPSPVKKKARKASTPK